MRITSTIVIWILALAGVAALMIWRGPDQNPRSRAAMQITRLFTGSQLPIDDVQRITLQRQDQPRMVFERSAGAGGWAQVEPFAYPMDPFSIRQLIALARELEVGDTLSPSQLRADQSLASLQLDPPAAQLKYEWPAGSRTIDLGRRGAAGWAYLRIAGEDEIRIVKHQLHERVLEMDPKEWRDRTIFRNVSVDSADRIERIESDKRLVLQRDRRQWKMIEPAQTRLDPAMRDLFIGDLARARAAGFIADQPRDLTPFGLNNPVASLTIISSPDSESQSQQRLLIGSRIGATTQDFHAMIEGQPVVFRLGAAALAAMFRQPRDLVAHTGSGTLPADVKTIVIRTGSDELRLQRDLERWIAPDFNNANIAPARVQELLDQLTQLRAAQVELAEYPRELEVATITFMGYDAKARDTVRIAKQKDTGNWIFENGDNVLRIHPASMKVNLSASDFGL